MNWKEFDKYKPAFDYIIENRPMHIVEYGGGESTYLINQLLDELNYGGKVTAYEDNPKFYNFSNKQGWNTKNSIKLVNIEVISPEAVIIRYIHPLKDVQDVDFFIVDGPDYDSYILDNGKRSSAIDNLHLIMTRFNKTIPFWIEGRSGQVNFMRNLNYKMITDYEV